MTVILLVIENKNTLEELKRKYNNLKKFIKIEREKNVKLKNNIEVLNKNILEKDNKIKKLELNDNNVQVNNNEDFIIKKMEFLDEDIKNKNKIINDFENNQENLFSFMDEICKENMNLKEKLESNKLQIAEKNTENKDLKDQITNLSKDISELRIKQLQNDEKIRNYSVYMKEKDQEIQTLETKIINFQELSYIFNVNTLSNKLISSNFILIIRKSIYDKIIMEFESKDTNFKINFDDIIKIKKSKKNIRAVIIYYKSVLGSRELEFEVKNRQEFISSIKNVKQNFVKIFSYNKETSVFDLIKYYFT